MVNYTLKEFRRQLDQALAGQAIEISRKQKRKEVLEKELSRLSKAIAEGGHSRTLIKAVQEREQEFKDIAEQIKITRKDPELELAEIGSFVKEQIFDLPGLLRKDIPLARAELLKHVKEIKMIPTKANGARFYVSKGEWDLSGNGYLQGDVRMVAGAGFEPATFGL